MEIEQIAPRIVGKKLWNMVRITFYFVKKGMSKRNKLMLDLKVALTLTLKRGKHAGKALTHLVHHHHRHLGAALTCRSDDSVQVVRPQYYEFSCSNTPRGSMFNKLMGHHRGHYSLVGRAHEDEVEDYNTRNVLRRALEIMNNGGPVASPLVAAPVRQLRVTDSPFLMDSPENSDDHHEVDVEAEEFIKKFYRDLSEEKEFAATLDSPSPFQFAGLMNICPHLSWLIIHRLVPANQVMEEDTCCNTYIQTLNGHESLEVTT